MKRSTVIGLGILALLAVLALAVFVGCATLQTAGNLCDPVVSEVQAIAKVFAQASWQIDIDKYIADGHALCEVQAAVDQVLGGQALTAAKADVLSPETLGHMRSWRAAHP